MNLIGLGDPVGFENLMEGRVNQRKLASLSFDAVGFGHGGPIARDASPRFRNKYGNHPARCINSDSQTRYCCQKERRQPGDHELNIDNGPAYAN